MELSIDRLTKQYQNKIAVDRISLRLNTGIYGLLGANGAGKTTLMRMVCGILKPTSGTITFDGIDVSEERYRSMLGYLPQDFGYYPEFTGEDFLLYMAALKGMRKPQARRKTVELLKLVSLHDVAKKKIKTYSGGMKQRLGIAQALLNQPKILVLDGTDGFHAALQLAFPLSSLNISVGGSVLVLLVNLIVISMVYGSLIMLLSAILKSNVAVMAIPVGIMILTMMVDIPYQFRLASQVYDLLPTNILNKTELWDDRLICIWGKYFTNFQIAPFLYVVFAVLLVIIGMVIYQRHQVQAR